MPTPSEAYNTEIAQAREDILRRVREGVLPEAQRAIVQTLAQVDPPSDGELTAERAQLLRERYNARLQRLSSELKGTAQAQKRQAQEETVGAHEAAILAAAALLSIPESEAPRPQDYALDVAGGTIDINVRRPVEDTTEAMIDRTLQSVGDDISEAIDEAQGEKTVSETIRNIGAVVARGSLSDALSEIGQEDLVAEDSDFSLASLSQLWRNVRRIVAHETAAIADETEKQLLAFNPAVGYVEWELSPRHPAPDVCDVLATQDLYGEGPGVYPSAVVPVLPHPNCLCSTRAILRDPSDWTTENEVPEERPEVGESSVRSLLEQAREEDDRSITDAHVASQTETLQEILSQVHEDPRG